MVTWLRNNAFLVSIIYLIVLAIINILWELIFISFHHMVLFIIGKETVVLLAQCTLHHFLYIHRLCQTYIANSSTARNPSEFDLMIYGTLHIIFVHIILNLTCWYNSAIISGHENRFTIHYIWVSPSVFCRITLGSSSIVTHDIDKNCLGVRLREIHNLRFHRVRTIIWLC